MESGTQSRRERPAKPALSRSWIISATIDIMRTEGLEKATMRRVAQELDTGPASLYVYVANTAELHSAVLDELIGSLPESGPSGSWAERLEELLGSYAEVLFTYPGLARSALVIRPSGPNAFGLYDRVLGLLLEGGIAPERAAWGVDLLLLYVTANAAEHSAPTPSEVDTHRDEPAEQAALAEALASVDPQKTPHVAAHMEAVLSGSPAQRVAWAIHALLAGIAATPTPPVIAGGDSHYDQNIRTAL